MKRGSPEYAAAFTSSSSSANKIAAATARPHEPLTHSFLAFSLPAVSLLFYLQALTYPFYFSLSSNSFPLLSCPCHYSCLPCLLTVTRRRLVVIAGELPHRTLEILGDPSCQRRKLGEPGKSYEQIIEEIRPTRR